MKLSRLPISNTPLKLRYPFKDKALRWKDDATMTEKLIWTIVIAVLLLLKAYLVFQKAFLTYLRGLEAKQVDLEDLPEL